MKKRFISLLLCAVLILSLGTTAFAASDEASSAAASLYALGLFNGTGTDKNGNPTYDLDLTPTRNQAVTMLVRLLGKSAEAETETWNTPFTDVDEWAKPYVGYAYANGLTAGTSATTYSGNANTTVKQYLTFILRALGYNSTTDFDYNTAWVFSDHIGLTDGRYNENTTSFTRGDVTYISYSALKCNLKNSDISLLQKLYDEGVVTYEEICQSGLSEYTTVETIPAPSHLNSTTGSDNDAFLTWTAPNADVTGYDLYVSTSKYGKYSLYQTGFSTSASIIEYTLKAGVTYFAKVQAFRLNEVVDKYGNTTYEEVRSEFSNATPFVIPSSEGGTVTPEKPTTTTPIEQVVLSESQLGITPGEVMEISATCIPMYAYPELTWTSSNPSVATVQYVETVKKENVYNGTTYDDAYIVKAKVTAVSAGSAVITVTAQNGTKATINVSVLGDNIAKAQAAVDALRSILKFPASLSLNSVRIYQGRYTDCVEIDYSAMNGFGGYNRGYYVYSGSSGTTYDYSVIDTNGHSYVTVDISKLK